MTHEEEQDLAILEIFINLKEPITNGWEGLQKTFKHLTGTATQRIIDDMADRGFIEKYYVNSKDAIGKGYRIIQPGINKYNSLRNQRKWELPKKIAFWLGSTAAIVAGVYAVLQFHFSGEPSKKESLKTEKHQAQSLINQIQPLKSDTIKVQSKTDSINNISVSAKRK
jgi:hypothetical protein